MKKYLTIKNFLALLLTPYVIWLISSYDYHFIDNANFLFHEAGHIILGFFGQTIHFLGGTILQLAIPAFIVVYFLREMKIFDAAVRGIWLGESLMYTAVYIGDAKIMSLDLAGGGIHDFNWLFTRWGLLDKAESMGSTLHIIASVIVIASLIIVWKSAHKKGKLNSE